MGESERDILAKGASELGIILSEAQLDQFDKFTVLLLEWNEKFNLTRITDPEEIAVKHYLDSLSVFKFVDIPVGSSIIDVGTGAGFPAIPLKIARPDLKITMLDSVRKRLTFLEEAVRELNLNGISILHSRAEDASKDKAHRERYDFSVARAVSKLNVLAELCIPFCRVGGRFAAYKGPDVAEEIEEAGKALRVLGGEIEAVHHFVLPFSDAHRSLIIVVKTKPTYAGFPRKPGVPEREPL